MTFRAALIQMCSSDDPSANTDTLRKALQEAAQSGADLALTPEVTNCVSTSARHQRRVLHPETEDPTLRAAREEAQARKLWVLIGSLALLTEDTEGRLANRSFLIDPEGQIRARYDKIHMFDVQVSETETYRESAGFRPGDQAVLASPPFATLGLSICYDLRFAYLYRALAQAGAEVLTVPSAFSPVTGAAHWEVLLRARAIETGCFVLAPAQSGYHSTSEGRARRTYGHSMAVAPWGEVLLDMGTEPGVGLVEIDPAQVRDARARVPALDHDRRVRAPEATT